MNLVNPQSNQSAAAIVPCKCLRHATPPPAAPAPAVTCNPTPAPACKPTVKVIKIDYVTSIFSQTKMNKAVSKHMPKNALFTLQTDKPWDTMKAQLLVKISDTLNPPTLDLSSYNMMVSIG